MSSELGSITGNAGRWELYSSSKAALNMLMKCFAAREMANETVCRVRYGEAFWRAHHEAWQQSALNQREYCEAPGIPLKAFGNWRAKFKAEPQPPVRKLLYRRRGLSHTLSHSVSHSLSHMAYGGAEPIVPPAREGHRRNSVKRTNAGSLRRRCSLAPACRRWRVAMG